MESIKFYMYTKNWYYPIEGNEKIYLLKTITDRTAKDIVDIIIISPYKSFNTSHNTSG